MKASKILMGLAVGLVLALLKVHKGEKLTFSGKLVFHYFWSFHNKLTLNGGNFFVKAG